MKKLLTTALLAAITVSLTAEERDELYYPLEPTYIGNYSRGCDWGSNWFVSLQGGADAFLGKPLGCGDLWDRIQPVAKAGLGKWFSSAWGARLTYEGTRFINCGFEKARYHNVHADLLCNITNGLGLDDRGVPRWDCIPYLGMGSVLHVDGKRHPFAMTAGLISRYHIGGGVHAMMEVSSTTTFADFDGTGNEHRLGDGFLNVSAGLSFTLGTIGWTRIVNAEPYIAQNEALRRELNRLYVERDKDQRAVAELRKILQLEGLMQKYSTTLSGLPDATGRNNYSGLNSLRRRIAERQRAEGRDTGPAAETYAMAEDGFLDGRDMSVGFYGEDSTVFVSVPVFFFFKLGTDELTDQSQLVNLDEIARVANLYDMDVNVFGAADSATGSVELNERLSQMRARYIAAELRKRGIDDSRMVRRAEGGIRRYDENERNRNSMVNLIVRRTQ